MKLLKKFFNAKNNFTSCAPFRFYSSGNNEISARLSLFTADNKIHNKSLAPKCIWERRFMHFNFTSTSWRSSKVNVHKNYCNIEFTKQWINDNNISPFYLLPTILNHFHFHFHCFFHNHKKNSGELPCERWNPTQNVRTILLSVISLLNEPNTFSPANVDASVMYRRWRDSNGRDNEYPNIIR